MIDGSHVAPHPAIGPTSCGDGAHAHVLRLLVICVAAAVTQFYFGRRGWFYLDDFRNLGQARQSGLGLRLLLSPIGNEHFQPGGRLLHWALVAGNGPRFGLAEVVLATSIGLTAFLTAALADLLFGARPLHLAIAAFIGTSSLLMETSTWVAGSDAIPSTALMAGSSLLYCRWFVAGKRVRLVAAVACSAAADLFWEQAIIEPFLLVLIWFCFLRKGSSRPALRTALSMVPFVASSAAFDLYVQSQWWYRPLERPSVSQFVQVLRVMVLHDLLPPVVGWRVGANQLQPLDRFAILASGSILVIGAVSLVLRRHLRWSALVFFTLSFLALAATIAATRVSVGPLAAATPRYVCPLPMLAGLSAAAAASGRAGLQEPPVRTADWRPAGTARRHQTRWPRLALLGFGLCYLVMLTHSANSDRFGRVNGQVAHAISDRVRRGLHPGMTNLVDTRLGWPVFYPSTDGSDEVSTLSPFWAPHIKAIGQGSNPVAVSPDGTVNRVVFTPGRAATIEYLHLTVAAKRATTMTVEIHGRKPVEPNHPYVLAVPAGRTSYLLPVWAAHLAALSIRHDRTLVVIGRDVGSITFAGTAAGSSSAG